MTITAGTFSSVGARFLAQCASSPQGEAFRVPSEDGRWDSVAWFDVARRSRHLAAGLLALGVAIEDRVAIVSSTRLEWVLADLAIALAGAATTMVYPSTHAKDVGYILSDCSAEVVFVENAEQLAKVQTAEGLIGAARRFVLFDGHSDDEAVLSLTQLAELGRTLLSAYPDAIVYTLAELTPDNLATIMYATGTTGHPKGIELTHGNWLDLGATMASEDLILQEDPQFLRLPPSHVLGKLLLVAQYEVGFVTAIEAYGNPCIPGLDTSCAEEKLSSVSVETQSLEAAATPPASC
ncbi:AMP-binding protein [Nocardia sp. NPDC056611]|uniref:AMP-binding protein n=1 Tax=Nocardia sp. NPDC056611 TaxID=3345877 RepID=UPI00366F9119